jgi:hypothetical protein
MGNVGIFLPVVVLVFWTFAIVLLMPFARFRSGFLGNVGHPASAHGDSGAAQQGVSIPNRAYMNLLEMPVLFYVGCLVLFVTGGASYFTIAIAWIFVAMRIAQSVIHLTYNRPSHRGTAFALGNVALVALWVVIAVHVLAVPSP